MPNYCKHWWCVIFILLIDIFPCINAVEKWVDGKAENYTKNIAMKLNFSFWILLMIILDLECYWIWFISACVRHKWQLNKGIHSAIVQDSFHRASSLYLLWLWKIGGSSIPLFQMVVISLVLLENMNSECFIKQWITLVKIYVGVPKN